MSTFVKKYNPNRNADWNFDGPKWRLSRSKIDLFIECPRCFYLDNKLGTARPRGPAFTLNVAVDALFKKEFDTHRANATQHPIMAQYGIDAVPYQSPHIDAWRDSFVGIEFKHQETGLLVCGGVDDIWIRPNGELIVVDYKATAKEGTIETLADSAWEEQYRRQIGVYQWLLRQNGYTVSNTGYFVYANGSANEDAFDNTLTFETTLIPCEGDTVWIEPTLDQIRSCLDANVLPKSGAQCEFCAYREAAGKKLQAVHAKRT